jgi:glycosyltransferase involved in cell wall biosynthesis
MHLSIVVCTCNRIDKLKRCIDAILASRSDAERELIVVDNGSTDATSAYLHELSTKRTSLPIISIREPRRGLARARNAGWRAANGEIVAFVDDDCYAAPDFADAVTAAFADPAIDFIGGRVLLYDRSDLNITIQEREEEVKFPAHCFVPPGEILGGNMAFRRCVLEAIGGFDACMGPGAKFNCEDVDAVARACWAGFDGIYTPNVVVNHHHGRRHREYNAIMRSYNRGTGAYYAKFVMRPDSRRTYLRILRMHLRNELRYWRFGYIRILFHYGLGAARYCVGI